MSIAEQHRSNWQQAALESTAWPFVEARRLLDHIGRSGRDPSAPFLLATGYGPSGLPHIGTFGEVMRTTMVRTALGYLSDHPSRLICFSDDLDALRRVPDNIPNRDRMSTAIGLPLSSVPDPFESYDSFAAGNNAQLRRFLDSFAFDYEFYSATEVYRSGRFDATLQRMLEHHDAIVDLVRPTLGAERRATYSPFLPICPESGHVLMAKIVECLPQRAEIIYQHPETGRHCVTSVLGGHCKMQWKADWALRWIALGVDYEMAGKDLAPSVKLSGAICRELGVEPPENMIYELFLDGAGHKISKSLGNGLTIDEWLSYAPPASLGLFMYRAPRRAKRLHHDLIVREVDAYLDYLTAFPSQQPREQLDNPAWHIHAGAPPAETMVMRFDMLLNLVTASDADDPDILWRFIRRYYPDIEPCDHPLLKELISKAVHYYQNIIRGHKEYRPATQHEADALQDLDRQLAAFLDDGSKATPEALQTLCYEIGKVHFDKLGDWFKSLYQLLLGRDHGPRFGSFICFYGITETRALIAAALRRRHESQLIDAARVGTG